MTTDDISGKIGISTVTLFRTSESDRIRAGLSLDSLAQAADLGYAVDLVDGGSSDEFLHEAERRGAFIHQLKNKSFGERTRYGIQQGYDRGLPVLMRLEIEKTPLISQIVTFASPLYRGEADFVIPHRGGEQRNLLNIGYPLSQSCPETFSNLWFQALTGIPEQLDMWGGTRAFRRELAHYFLDPSIDREYSGADGKPNNWACYFIPVLRIIEDSAAKGHRIASVPIQFTYPAEQARLEAADPAFTEKRRLQLQLINDALLREWSKKHTPFTSGQVTYT